MSGENESTPMLLQRNRTMDRVKPAAEQQPLEVLQQVNTNKALASQFPDWDLKPPGQLIRRRSSKLL